MLELELNLVEGVSRDNSIGGGSPLGVASKSDKSKVGLDSARNLVVVLLVLLSLFLSSEGIS